MCCSMHPASFSETIVYVGEQFHPKYGLVHVMAYQNTAINYNAGPNAMILHIPGQGMTQDNFIDTGDCRSFLKDMVQALQPPRRDILLGSRSIAFASLAPVQVFEHDIYTVVLSEDASLIPQALSRVPENKRPAANQPLFDFYAREWPNWSVALCCFDNKQAAKAAPLMVWYHPLAEDTLHWPSIDSHTGEVPNLHGMVAVEHWIIGGSHRMTEEIGVPVRYRGGCSPDVTAFLPDRVIGMNYNFPMQNGDFVIDTEKLVQGNAGSILRVPAPSVANII